MEVQNLWDEFISLLTMVLGTWAVTRLVRQWLRRPEPTSGDESQEVLENDENEEQAPFDDLPSSQTCS